MMQILAYITDDRERVVAGAPLALHMPKGKERSACLADLELALRANVVQLPNGDHILLSKG